MKADEARRMMGWTRVIGALWFIVAAVIAATLARIQHRYFLALIALTAGAPGLIAGLTARPQR